MIKKIFNQLFSMQVAGYVVVLLAFAMAGATFIENSSGTIAAKALVYNAWWFEALIGITFISVLLNIFKFKLYRLKKLPIFLFHFAFLVIILGATVTRYISSEGTMHIREGESSNVYQSFDTYFYASFGDGENRTTTKQKIFPSSRSGKQVKTALKYDSGRIKFSSTKYTSGRQMAAQMGGGMPDDVLTVKVKVNGKTEEVLIRGRLQQPIRVAQYEVNGVIFNAGFGSMAAELPFSIALEDFQLERYPGSNSPSSFASEVVLNDSEEGIEMPYRIYMNHILKHRGYRFYQSSYDQDEQGTVLSVNNDALGTGITYLGYFLMMVTILMAMLAPGGRFVRLVKETRKPVRVGIIALLLMAGLTVQAQTPEKVSSNVKEEATEFGKVWVQGIDGRFKPVSSLAQEMTRKLFRSNRYENMSSEEFWLRILIDPVSWERQPIFEIENVEIANKLGTSTTKVSFSNFFQNGQYKLSAMVNQAVSKKPNERNGTDKDLLKLDEQLNVFYMAYTGQLLRLYPIPGNPENKWLDVTHPGIGLGTEDSTFVTTAFPQYLKSVSENSLANAALWREAIQTYQKNYGSTLIPSDSKAHLEMTYNRLLIFERLTIFYAMLGLILLALQFITMFKPAKWQSKVNMVFGALFVLGFILHTIGLGIRWYVSGHAPMSNGYESMIFVAWGTLLAGVLLMKRSKMALALTAVLAALSLLVAHLSWMTPEITPLVPVLKSPWLTIHVAVIMTSYSFLGLGALTGMVTMFLYIAKNKRNEGVLNDNIEFLTKLNKIVLIAGLYLITIGCFLGAIWANVSWGRYWGWDPKETWCLISILVYTFITHMHNIKGMESNFSFNLGSVLGFSSIIMTYFGVNYFLGGMHSYAGGATPSVPMGVYVAVILVIGIAYWAYFNQQKFEVKKD